jgi:hypothetical protein
MDVADQASAASPVGTVGTTSKAAEGYSVALNAKYDIMKRIGVDITSKPT